MFEWVFVALALATGGVAADQGSFYEIVSPLPATMGAVYATDNIDEVASPIPGTVIETEEESAAK